MCVVGNVVAVLYQRRLWKRGPGVVASGIDDTSPRTWGAPYHSCACNANGPFPCVRELFATNIMRLCMWRDKKCQNRNTWPKRELQSFKPR
jgi:hypothetical protein